MIIIKYSVMEFSEVLKKVVFVFGLEVGDGSEVARVRDFFFFFHNLFRNKVLFSSGKLS